jgi:dephospho-CoA kinase
MIIGITGSFGAGKGAVVEYLISRKGYKHYSASGFITEEIQRRGVPVDRDSMIAVGNSLRKERGPSYIVEQLFARAENVGGHAVIEALRAVAEVEKLRTLGAIIIGVDASPGVRYQRSVERGSEKDAVSFDTWQAQEREESNTEDPTKQNIFGALALSDYTIMNNGTLEELHAQIDDVLKKIEAKA